MSIALIALIFAAFVGGGNGNKKSESLGTPVATLSAPALWQQFGDNEIAADEKYKGKTVEFTGTVAKVNSDGQGASVGIVTVSSYLVNTATYQRKTPQEKKWYNEGYPPNVICYFTKKAKPRLSKLTKGGKVQVVGRVVGKKSDSSVVRGYVVVLERCEIRGP